MRRTERSPRNDNTGDFGAAGWEYFYSCTEDSKDGTLLYLYESLEDVGSSLRQLPCDELNGLKV